MRIDRVPPDPGGELAVPLFVDIEGNLGDAGVQNALYGNHARSEKCKNIRKLLDSLA